MRQCDVLLINPSNRKTYGALGSNFAAVEPPWYLGLLAAYLRQQGFFVQVLDADVLGLGPEETAQKIVSIDPLLTVIAVLGSNPSASSTPKMEVVGRLLDVMVERAPKIKTLLLGIHPSALPQQTLQREPCHFVCRGEAFITVSRLLEVLQQNPQAQEFNIPGLWYKNNQQIVDAGWSQLVKDLDALPITAWDLLPMDMYRAHNWHCFGRLDKRAPYAVVYTSLGCPFHCEYCNIHALYDGKSGIRFRLSQSVINEIDVLVQKYNIENIKIADELFVINQQRVDEICDLLIQRRYSLNIWAYARIDTVNKNMLEKLYKAGVRWLAYGIESADNAVRQNVNKQGFGLQEVKDVVRMTQETGISVVGNFIFGLPNETMQTMQATLDLANQLLCEYANFYVMMAYPGSAVYEQAVKKQSVLPANWLGYGQFSEEAMPLPTQYLTSGQILQFRDQAFRQYHSNPAYIQMIREKFGDDTVSHIQQMLNQKIRRTILEENK